MKRRSLRELVRYVERCRWGEPRKNDVGEFGRQCLPNLMGAATPKKKWFQVTRFPALLAAGMQPHRTLRSGAPCATAGSLHECRFSRPPLQRVPTRCSFLLRNGTVRSKRPFPRPQRLPLSRIPFRGQWSRPAPSLSRQPALSPVRPFRSTASIG